MEFSCHECQKVFPINQLCVCKRNRDEKTLEKLLKLLVCEKCAEKHEEICEESIHLKNARRLIVNATSNSIDEFLETFMNRIRLSLRQIEGSAERCEKDIRRRQANLEDSNESEMGNKLITLFSKRDKALSLINSLKAYQMMVLNGNVPFGAMGSKVKNDENKNFKTETENMNEKKESELVYDRAKLYQLGKQNFLPNERTMGIMTKWELFKQKKEKMKLKTPKGKSSIVERGTANQGILKKKEVSFENPDQNKLPSIERDLESTPFPQINPLTKQKAISPPRKSPTPPPIYEPAPMPEMNPWYKSIPAAYQSNSSLPSLEVSAKAMHPWDRSLGSPTLSFQKPSQALPPHPLKNIKSNGFERTTSPSLTTSSTTSRSVTPFEFGQSTQNPSGSYFFDVFKSPLYDDVLPIPSYPWFSMSISYNYLRAEYRKEQKRAILDAKFIEITGLRFDGETLHFNLNNKSNLPMLIRFLGWEPRGNGVKIVFPGWSQPDERQYYKMCFELPPNHLTLISVDFSEAKHVLQYYAQQNSPEYYAYVHLSGKGQLNKDGYFALTYATVCLKYNNGKWLPESTSNRPIDHFRWKT